MHDLLNDELIGVRSPEGVRRVSLPDLLSLLCQAEVDGYTGLRAHQADPWHVFLVQIAASILARHPQTSPPTDAAYWRDGLLNLAEGARSAWLLIEDDVTKPAFLQHPWTSWEAEAEDFGARKTKEAWRLHPKARTPDELDVLITAKNHDVKASRISAVEVEAWLYALLIYQTTSGFLGAGNYGIVRMNGGFASRPFVSWVSSPHPSRRFLEELCVVQNIRDEVIRRHGYRQRGVTLSWLYRWDRSGHQFALRDLEPWFIETCRPVRLRMAPDGSMIALGATSGARQIGPKSLDGGDVGDPWIPINNADKKKGRSALTVSTTGFSARLVTDLLFEQQGFELTDLQRPRPGSEPGWLVATVLVRGQGTTEGFHQLTLLVPARARLALSRPSERQQLAALAQTLLGDAKDAASALRTAFTVLVEGGPEQADFDREAVKGWVDASMTYFSRHWTQHYFDALWRGADEPHEAVRRDWHARLLELVQRLLDEGLARLPGITGRRWRAKTQARAALFGTLKKKNLLPANMIPEEDFA